MNDVLQLVGYQMWFSGLNPVTVVNLVPDGLFRVTVTGAGKKHHSVATSFGLTVFGGVKPEIRRILQRCIWNQTRSEKLTK